MNPLQHSLVLAIRVYRWTLSPAQVYLFGAHSGCRFTPTCSVYALDAIRAQGAFHGGWLALQRVARCHPWGECGHDPVPPRGARTLVRFNANSRESHDSVASAGLPACGLTPPPNFHG